MGHVAIERANGLFEGDRPSSTVSLPKQDGAHNTSNPGIPQFLVFLSLFLTVRLLLGSNDLQCLEAPFSILDTGAAQFAVPLMDVRGMTYVAKV